MKKYDPEDLIISILGLVLAFTLCRTIPIMFYICLFGSSLNYYNFLTREKD